MTGGMVIVGAGEAGARAAGALREGGYDGLLTLVGDEAHAPYERPPLSKGVMTAPEAGAPPFILDVAALRDRGIAHAAGTRAERIDREGRRVLLRDGRSIVYQKLLIATGARPRTLSVPGAGPDTVLYLRNFADALRLRERLMPGRRLVVIGGGFIGLEVAASAIGRGCAVTLIEMAPRILMRGVPERVAALVRARHEAAGVRFRIGTGLERIERRGDAAAVVLQDGTAVEGDAVVAGVGAIPNTALAAASGLAVDNGIRVDAALRSDDPDIFAAGDCCSFPHPLYGGRRLRLEAWRNARDQGEVAARNMMGGNEDYCAVPWFWSDQYDQTLQVAGLPDEGRAIVERDLGAGLMMFHLDGDGRLVGVSGIGTLATAKDFKVAEMLVAARARPDPRSLAAPSVRLRSLLR